MLENDNGCDRCRDYDKVREELENNKRKSSDDQKNALKKCEESKSQLQKKLLTVGAVAIIGGTILGKDLVDKVAEYIESFNKVKDAATGLVGMATPTVNTPVDEKNNNDNDDVNEPEEESETKSSPRVPYTSGYAMDSLITSPLSYGDLGLIDMITMNDSSSPLEMLLEMNQEPVVGMNLSSMLMDFTTFGDNELILYMPEMKETPSFLEASSVVTVPSTHTLSVFMLLPAMRGRRRRR